MSAPPVAAQRRWARAARRHLAQLSAAAPGPGQAAAGAAIAPVRSAAARFVLALGSVAVIPPRPAFRNLAAGGLPPAQAASDDIRARSFAAAAERSPTRGA